MYRIYIHTYIVNQKYIYTDYKNISFIYHISHAYFIYL